MSTVFNKSQVQASDLVSQAYTYVANQFEQVAKVFTLSSAYGQILSVIAQLTTMILYFIEDSTTEMNILTASRVQSIQGLARLAGHNATRAVSATGEISFVISAFPQVQGTQIIIPNFTTIKCLNNNMVYTLMLTQEEMRLDSNSKITYNAQVMQGTIETQIFTGNGTPLQSFTALTTGSTLVDNFYVNVYVNGESWQIYDSLYDIPRNGKGCLVKTGISGGIDIYFGNTNAGMPPPLGAEIRIEYLLTGGEGGNLREGDNVTFQWIDSGYSVIGEEIDLNSALSTSMSTLISFGSNPEPTFLTKLIAPKTSRSYVLANPENYIIFLEKFNYFSVVDAYTTFNDQYIDDNNVIYLFLIPDITKRLLSSENYFTVPIQYFTLTEDEQNKVINVIEDSGSKIVTTVVSIVQPIISRYVINISLITFTGYSLDVIRNSIVSRLSDYFLSLRRRDIVPTSDIVSLIAPIPGIDSVNVSFLCENNEIAKTGNPGGPVIGLDELGDIVLDRNELTLIRGGWTDSNGIYYNDGIYSDRPCSVNISIKDTVTQDLNSMLFQQNMTNIINNTTT